VDSLRTRDAVLLGDRRWRLHRLDRLGVDTDVFGRPDARDRNVELEYARNSER
jgi:hypothetical protein